MREIWKLREHIAEALLHDGDGCFKVVSLVINPLPIITLSGL